MKKKNGIKWGEAEKGTINNNGKTYYINLRVITANTSEMNCFAAQRNTCVMCTYMDSHFTYTYSSESENTKEKNRKITSKKGITINIARSICSIELFRHFVFGIRYVILFPYYEFRITLWKYYFVVCVWKWRTQTHESFQKVYRSATELITLNPSKTPTIRDILQFQFTYMSTISIINLNNE